ncbi:hypothetical protein GCM10028861_21960 [Flavobacterium koreense]
MIYACGGSESYQGKWKALDTKGNKFEITFTENKLLIKDSLGELSTYNYVQHSAGHIGSSNNFTDSFEIQLNNGLDYQIFFPMDDQNVGVIKHNGENIYSISKKEYLSIDKIILSN